MTYSVFLSYSRDDLDDPLRTFFENLRQEIKRKLGCGAGQEVVFWDQESIRNGHDWNIELLNALQQCRVLVSLYSPSYFKRPVCGKEWRLFYMRREQYGRNNNCEPPPIIKPVMWIPFSGTGRNLLPDHLGSRVLKIQCRDGDFGLDINKNGLRLLSQFTDPHSKNVYIKFLDYLSTDIVNTLLNYDVPPICPTPSLDEIPCEFGDDLPSNKLNEKLEIKPSSFRKVKFIHAALAPQEIAGSRELNYYEELGGPDWKPFYPDSTRPIGAIAASIAASEGLDFTPGEMKVTEDLVKTVQLARDESAVVVILLDCWSLLVSEYYQRVFYKLDQVNLHNCVILLPWNPGDLQLKSNKEEIEATLDKVLDAHKNDYSPSSPNHCKHIESYDELNVTLRSVLTKIQAKMRKHGTVRRVKNVIPLPEISGPGGAQ